MGLAKGYLWIFPKLKLGGCTSTITFCLDYLDFLSIVNSVYDCTVLMLTILMLPDEKDKTEKFSREYNSITNIHSYNNYCLC